MNFHPASTPAYIVEAIPGAAELLAEYTRLRAEHGAKGAAMRAAGEAASAITTPGLHDPLRKPAPGVKRTDWEKAIDRYRVAQDEVSASNRALDRAVRAFSRHINEGVRTEAFKAHYNALGEAAQADAAEKLTALRAALTTRDEVNRWMGRRLPDPTAHGVSYTLREITGYVEAVPVGRSYFRERALEAMQEEILMPDDRASRLRVIDELDARVDLTDAAKLASYRGTTGRRAQ